MNRPVREKKSMTLPGRPVAKRKLSGLMSTSVRSLRFTGGVGDHIFQNAAVRVGIARPQFQFGFGFLGVWRGQHGRLKITDLPSSSKIKSL